MRILVTGSNGFVGIHACTEFSHRGFDVCAFSRKPYVWPVDINGIYAKDLLHYASTSSSFQGVDCILHLAGRAHVMHEFEMDPLQAFRASNVVDTLQFARAAALAGVRRFVFISSIKVNGENSSLSSPFTDDDVLLPSDPYALSKREAEIGLLAISAETGMEIVIVRPPLIYGPGVKGNFQLLMTLVKRRVPLPLSLVRNNRRSFISVYNFVDFLALCVVHPKAAGNIFLVSDQEVVSTYSLLCKIGGALNCPALLFPVPDTFLKLFAISVRKYSMYRRLCGSLVVDRSRSFRILGWSPPLSMDESLRRTFEHF